jgi:hypothetical protein
VAKVGDVFAIPRGMLHAFRNFSGATARIIGILSPAGFENLLFAMKGRPLDEFPKVASSYGLEIVGPQIAETAAELTTP